MGTFRLLSWWRRAPPTSRSRDRYPYRRELPSYFYWDCEGKTPPPPPPASAAGGGGGGVLPSLSIWRCYWAANLFAFSSFCSSQEGKKVGGPIASQFLLVN